MNLKEFLDIKSEEYNNTAFIENDPIQVPHKFKTKGDIEGYKKEVVSKAEGEVSRFNKLLEEYKKAPEVTRARLRIDMNQSVYSNSTKIMVDTEGGNNLLYLPLDKIMEQNKKSEED